MIITVASGKGGTGKTLISTSLAVSLNKDQNMQLLDCDVEEPNDHIFIKPKIEKQEKVYVKVPKVDEEKCNFCKKCSDVCNFNAIAVLGQHVLVFPELCHGCGACSYLCPQKAITEQPREIGVVESGQSDGIAFAHGKLNIGEVLAPRVISAVKDKIDGKRTVVIDSPPGTSCPVIEAIKDSDFCLLVTEPTPFGLNDLKLAVETVRKLQIPSGVIINRYVEGELKVEEYCRDENIPVLLKIPLDTGIARLYSRGEVLVNSMPDWKASFLDVYEKIREIVNERSSSIKR
jgi:MinD superfamily P-loop ATPase